MDVTSYTGTAPRPGPARQAHRVPVHRMPIRKILLIDDDEDIRTITSVALSSVGGWETVLAGSGPEGVSLAVSARPDAILLDVMMPGMDGFMTLEALRANSSTHHIPVIFMTAKVQRREVGRYHPLGVSGVIAKPFDPMTLADEIRGLIGGSPCP